MPSLFLARRGLAAAALLLALPLFAQEGQEGEPRSAEPDLPEQGGFDDPPHAFEFALGGDGLWFTYRSGLHRGKGYTSLGFFASQDDDFVLHAQLMRFGEPRADVPLGMGVGLGLFGAEVDETSDEVLALTLTGAADYALDRPFGLTYPTRVGVEVSWAPDIATFADGERVLDLLGRVEVDLSTWATGFVGYRHLEVDLTDGGDAELDSAFQAGVRLGF
jgi:hypothetical protein